MPVWQQHLKELQRYVAKVGMTASALRNLGAKGFVKVAIEFLSAIDLRQLATTTPAAYPQWLDTQTTALMQQFPLPNLWGPARKAVNIFMVMATLNTFLRDEYGLDKFENVLEVPLDNTVVKKLRKFGRTQKVFLKRADLPKWDSIKKLDPTNSAKHQRIADVMSAQRGIPRGRLDVALF
jgi:hypothetical protein